MTAEQLKKFIAHIDKLLADRDRQAGQGRAGMAGRSDQG